MPSQDSSVLQAKRLLTGLVIGESPRWQDVRLWFANCGTEQIIALELAGNAEVAAKGPPALGWSRLAARRFDGAACRPERPRCSS